MMKKSKKSHYQNILGTEYQDRCQRNTSYSLAAFARDLGIAKSSLSMLLQGKRKLSVKTAERIALRLCLSENQKNEFLQSVRSTSVKIKSNEKNFPLVRPKQMDLNNLNFALNWRHLALRELISLPDFCLDYVWLSQKISTTVEECEKIWKECLRSGLIQEVSDQLYVAQDPILFGDNGINLQIQQYHRDFLSRALEAIQAPYEKRNFSSTLFPVSERQHLEVVRLVRQFSSDLSQTFKLEDTDEKDRVLCLATQIFSL